MGIKKIKNVGRPPMKEHEKRKTISFKAKPTLLKSIDSQSKLLFGGNRTKYITYCLNKKSNQNIKINSNSGDADRLYFYELIKEINKIGTNINQIAKRVNIGLNSDKAIIEGLDSNKKIMEDLMNILTDKLRENSPMLKKRK